VGAAGWSAVAKAELVRAEARGGLWRRFLRVLGLDAAGARAEAVAGRWEAGARGEAMTAELLLPLAAEGWGAFHDRALPTGRANFDHVLVPPSGRCVVLVDSKLWSRRRGDVRGVRGQLLHGDGDRSGAVRSLLYETGVLERELARVLVRDGGGPVAVLPVVVVHSAPVAGGAFTVQGIRVVEAGGLLPFLRGVGGVRDQVAFDRLRTAGREVLPRYVEKGGRR
jgi:hypothetical protein